MARPKNLQTRGYFSVIDSGNGVFVLLFRCKYVLASSLSRHHLYTVRSVYSSWFSRIVSLLKLTGTELSEVD